MTTTTERSTGIDSASQERYHLLICPLFAFPRMFLFFLHTHNSKLCIQQPPRPIRLSPLSLLCHTPPRSRGANLPAGVKTGHFCRKGLGTENRGDRQTANPESHPNEPLFLPRTWTKKCMCSDATGACKSNHKHRAPWRRGGKQDNCCMRVFLSWLRTPFLLREWYHSRRILLATVCAL